jgi:hypothetical protein
MCNVHVQADAQVCVCSGALQVLTNGGNLFEDCLCDIACGACACAHGCTHARLIYAFCARA